MQAAATAPVSGLAGLALRVLQVGAGTPTATQLLAVSILLRPDAIFDASRVAALLVRHRLGSGTPNELAELTRAAVATGAYARDGEQLTLRKPGWAEAFVHGWLSGLAQAARKAELEEPQTVVRIRAQAEAPAPQRPASARRRATPAPAPTPSARRAAAPVAAAPEAPPAPAPAPQLAAPPAAPPLDVEAVAPRVDALLALLGSAGSLTRVSLALRAHALGTAEKFHELIGLGSLVGVTSHPYQIETVRRVLRTLRGRALLADEVGLGKTIEALMILREYQLRGMARRILVLTPAALVQHWVGELTEKGGLEVRSTQGAALKQLAERFWSDDGIVVASLALARAGKHAEAVRAQSWDLVIVDEAHHVKNRRTASYELVNGLRSRFLLLLTATPIETGLDEIYNLVTLIKPGQFATPAAFRKQFVDSQNPTSPNNRERLRGLLREVMVRNTRAACGLQLPPRFVTTVTVEPTADEQQLYGEVLGFVREHASVASSRMLVSTLLLEAGSSSKALAGTLLRLIENDRHAPAVRERARQLQAIAQRVDLPSKDARVVQVVEASPDQALVFTRYRAAAEHLAQCLARKGLAVELFHGGLTGEQKTRALERFAAGTRCLVATDVGGEGQNLQFCHLLINYDLPWNPMQIEQRIGRLHRMGQTEPVQVFNLCGKGTAEERLLDVLDRRLHLFELVVGEMDMVLGNLADERDLEERILDLYASSTSEADLDQGFTSIADELSKARSRYERTRAFDEALFGTDYQT